MTGSGIEGGTQSQPSGEIGEKLEFFPIQERLARQFSDNPFALTFHLRQLLGLGARWSPHSPYKYQPQQTLYGADIEPEYIDLLHKTRAAGLDRQDKMYGYIEPAHHIYDMLFSSAEQESHAEFIAYLDSIIVLITTPPKDSDSIEALQAEQVLSKFSRLVRNVTDAECMQMVRPFSKTGESLPLEEFDAEIMCAYLYPQYWRDVVQQEVGRYNPGDGQREPQDLRTRYDANFLDWATSQYTLLAALIENPPPNT